MKFGFRIPSINKRIAARTSVKRLVQNQLGLKVPRGYGWLTNPKKAAYNRVYYRTSRGCLLHLLIVLFFLMATHFNGKPRHLRTAGISPYNLKEILVVREKLLPF